MWLPAAPFVGFTLAETVFDLGGEGDWELWKAALLGALLMAPFAVGGHFGLRSVLKGLPGRLGGPRHEPRPGGAGDRHADRGVPQGLTAELAQGCGLVPSAPPVR